MSQRLLKARQKHSRPFFEKYYTLEINPMTKVLKTEGQINTNGLKQALHLCRGHFKAYDGKGLFGKYTGTYWWPSHYRGNESIGLINKTYEIGRIP